MRMSGNLGPSLPAQAVTDADTASPPDPEIAAHVLEPTAPFLRDCHAHTHTRARPP